ncbi:MAG: DUF2993 domain-containing protein [Micropruina sp.]|nr:MAG: DUF2993 domain-containing protein [Micropruina sp.]
MRRLLVVLAVLVLLGGAAVGGELWTRTYLADQIAQGLQRELALSGPPAVSLTGGPVLVGLARQRLDGVHAETAAWPMTISGYQVTLRDPVVDATGIAIKGRDAVIGRLAATARLDTADLSTLAGVPVQTDNGRLAIDYSVTVLGQELTARVSGVPELDPQAQTLKIGDAQISVVGFPLTPELSQQLVDQVVKPIPVTLDYGLKLEAIRVAADGLTLQVTGQDVVLPWRR